MGGSKQRVDVYFNFIGLVELPAAPDVERPPIAEAPKERYVAANTSFAPLGEYLSQQTADNVSLAFTEVEKLIGKPLCKSAFKFYSYWYPGDNRPISNVIYNAGFDVDRVDLKNQMLYLTRATQLNTTIRQATVTIHDGLSLHLFESTLDKRIACSFHYSNHAI